VNNTLILSPLLASPQTIRRSVLQHHTPLTWEPTDSPQMACWEWHSKKVEPVFSIKLTSNGGELYLGGSNTNLYTGEIAYTDVTVVGFWQVEIARIQGDRGILLADVPAIIDTESLAVRASGVDSTVSHATISRQ